MSGAHGAGAPGVLSYRTAALRSVLNPGSGQEYAGARLRGGVTWLAFLLAVLGAGWVGLELVGALRGLLEQILLAGGLEEGRAVLRQAPLSSTRVLSCLAPFLLIELIWYAALADSLDLCRRENRRRGHDHPPHPAMVALSSMTSPGAGHLYAGGLARGWYFVAGYALSKLVAVPATVGATLAWVETARSVAHLGPTAMLKLTAQAGAGGASLTGWLIELVWLAAVVDAQVSSRSAAGDARMTPGWRAVTAGGLGFFCPGAGHLMLGHEATGWTLLGVYVLTSGMAALTGGWVAWGLGMLVALGGGLHAAVAAHRGE